MLLLLFFFSSRRRHTRCALVTGVQTCALPICYLNARQTYKWNDGLWSLAGGYAADKASADAPHVVAIDYGIKRNILRNLVDAGARVTVLPATATFEEIMAHEPDGLFLSNGPGDPAATGVYAGSMIQQRSEEHTSELQSLMRN